MEETKTSEADATRFVECDFPQPAKDRLIEVGAKPLKAIVLDEDNHRVVGILSEGPSGENGAMELHLSVSASTRTIGRHMPTLQEVKQAAEAAGLDMAKCQVATHMLAVHLFQSKECTTNPAAEVRT